MLLLVSSFHFTISAVSHFNFDDYKLVVLNPALRDFRQVWTVLSAGRPVRGLTLMLDYALFGLDPRGYHFHNVFWHLLGSGLFYFLVYRLFKNFRLAFISAFLFVFHPVHNEAVMSISHRKELLAFTFLLAAYHAYLYRARRPLFAWVLFTVFFMLGLLSKQVVIVLPVILLFHELLFSDRKKLKDFRVFAWFGVFLLMAGVAALGGTWLSLPVLRDFNLFGRFVPDDLASMKYLTVVSTSLSVFPRYLRFLLFPVHSCPVFTPPPAEFWEPRTLLGLSLFFALPAGAWLLRKDKIACFSLGWIWLNLLPIMNFIPANAFFAERYLYIPSGGLCLLVAGLWNRLYESRREFLGGRLVSFFSVIISYFFLLNRFIYPFVLRIEAIWPLNNPFRMERSLAIFTASCLSSLLFLPFVVLYIHRNARKARSNYLISFTMIYGLILLLFLLSAVAIEYLLTGRADFPAIDVQKQWEIFLGWMRRHGGTFHWKDRAFYYPWGTELAETVTALFYIVGGAAFAIFLYLEIVVWAARKGPTKKILLQLLLIIFSLFLDQDFFRAGDWSSEVRLWRYAVMEAPGSLHAWNNLGKAYMERKRYDLAAWAYEQAARLGPELAENHRNLGIALLQAGRLSEAERAFERAVELSPRDIPSRNNLANILVLEAARRKDLGFINRAVEQYLEILELDPRNAHACYNLAYSYMLLGKPETALEYVNKALLFAPRYEKARRLREVIIQALRAAEPGE